MRVRLIWLATVAGFVWMQLATSERLDIGIDGAVWESYPPGQLLRILDRSIAATSRNNHSAVLAPTSTITRRADLPNEDVTTEDVAASREFDYDRAYEEFVQQYFSDSSSSAEKDVAIEDEEGSSVAWENQSAEQQHNPDALFNAEQSESLEPQATRRAAKRSCKRVRGNGQVCVVCSNPKNDATSETCSYSKQSEPQRYVYEKQRSFKTHRGSNNAADLGSGARSRHTEQREDESGEHDDDDYAVQKPRRKYVVSRGDNASSCIKQIKEGKLCYSCRATDGATGSKCVELVQPISDERKSRLGRRNAQKVHKTQQRIYKRTVSYSIEKGSNGTAAQSEPNENAGNATMGPPLAAERVFIKFVKQKATLAH